MYIYRNNKDPFPASFDPERLKRRFMTIIVDEEMYHLTQQFF